MTCNIEDENGYTTSQEQLGPVLRAKLQNEPTENQIKALSRRLFQIWEQLSVQNGQLYRQYLPHLDLSLSLSFQLINETRFSKKHTQVHKGDTWGRRIRSQEYVIGSTGLAITRMFANGARRVRIVQPQKLNHTLTVPLSRTDKSTWKSLCPGRSGLGTLQSNSSVCQQKTPPTMDGTVQNPQTTIGLSLSIAEPTFTSSMSL